jgi:hypothetical protein
MYELWHYCTCLNALSLQELFNDVTSGSNNCCEYDDVDPVTCCTSGFTAATGWDPTTGLGSINFNDFAAMFGV